MSSIRCTLACLALGLAACSEPPATATATTTATPATAYNLTLGMKDFMNLVLEPTADVLWDSAGWVNDIETGYQELYPTNDADWDMVRQRAAQIVEAGNALALPGRAVDSDAWDAGTTLQRLRAPRLGADGRTLRVVPPTDLVLCNKIITREHARLARHGPRRLLRPTARRRDQGGQDQQGEFF